MKKNKFLVLDIVIAALFVGFIAIQFIPYFCYKDETYSLAKFLWLDAENLKKFGKAINGAKDYVFNDSVDFLVLSFILPIVVVGLSFWKPASLFKFIADVAWSFCATYGYLTNNLMRTATVKENAYLLNPSLFWLYIAVIVVIDGLLIWRAFKFFPEYIKKFQPQE